MDMNIVEGKGCFSSKWNIDTTSGCENQCKYCYGLYLNKKPNVIIKNCNTNKLDRQWKKLNTKHNYIRIGKFTDPGYESIEFKKLIDWMINNNIKPIVVTKMPHEDKDIYNKITNIGGVYQITIGYDSLEQNLVKKYSNKKRFALGCYYRKGNKNVIFRLVRECSGPANERTKYYLDEWKPIVLLTPLRVKNKDIITQLGGDINKYEFYKGFYRIKFDGFHKDYDVKNLHTCCKGNQYELCSKCLLK